MRMTSESREALSAALRAADRLLSRHVRDKLHEGEGSTSAYAELMACLDTCSTLPGSEQVAPGIAQRRLVATTIYNRSDDEAEAALQELLRIEPELMRRAMSTLSSCRERPTLLAKYLPPLIAELEAAVANDFNLWRALTSAYEARAELEAPGSTTSASGPPGAARARTRW
jgi:hypothetical protein